MDTGKAVDIDALLVHELSAVEGRRFLLRVGSQAVRALLGLEDDGRFIVRGEDRDLGRRVPDLPAVRKSTSDPELGVIKGVAFDKALTGVVPVDEAFDPREYSSSRTISLSSEA